MAELSVVLGVLAAALGLLLWWTEEKRARTRLALDALEREATDLRNANQALEGLVRKKEDEIRELFEDLVELDPTRAMDLIFDGLRPPSKADSNN